MATTIYGDKTNYADSLMRLYDKELHDIISLEEGIYSMIPVATEVKAIGAGHYFFIETSFNEDAVGTRQPNTAIPLSSYTVQIPGYVTERALYADVKVDLRAEAVMANGGSIISDPAMHEVTRAGQVARKELARMVYCDGTGVIATASGAGTSATALLLDKTGGPKKSGKLYLRARTSIDAYDGATQKIDKIMVNSVAKGTTTDTATLASAQTWTTGSSIYRYDVYASTADTDWEGMFKCFDDDTDFASYAGIDSGNYPDWQGIRDTNGGTPRAFDPETLAKLLIERRQNAGGDIRNEMIISNLGQPFEYWKYAMPGFRINVDKSGPKFDVGVALGDAQPFMGVPWKTDVNCPYGVIALPDLSNFKKWELKAFGPPKRGLANKGWTWDNSTRYDAAETYRAMYGNFICTRRNTQILYEDLTENFLS